MSLETINGKDYLAFFRRFADRTEQDAARHRFMTELTISMEMETDTTTTVDGTVNSIADGENTAEFTSIAYRSRDKDTINTWKEMRKWFLNKDLVEFWKLDIASMAANVESGVQEYDVDYFQGRFTSFEISSEADGLVELTFEFAIDGQGIWDKKDVLTDEQKLAAQAASYGYHTLAKETDV